MTNYREKYREALREGDAEKANEFYNKRKNDEEEDKPAPKEAVDSEEEEVLKSPGDMTVSEAKEYAEDVENVEDFLELEKEGKDRKTLVEHLEEEVE